MKKFLIDRKIEIDAAHRVHLHGSKCGRLHGHRYSIHAVCSGPLAEGGEEDGMVMDFGFLKEEMMSVIDDCCDHGLILSEKDPLLRILLSREYRYHPISGSGGFSLISLEFRVSAALSAPSGVKIFLACGPFRVKARPQSGRALQARCAIEGCSTSFGYAPCLPRSRSLSAPG
jgi:6-pyruvoyl tetrahydropterin synthase/QueD family protein